MAPQPKLLICDDDALAVRSLARAARAAGWTVFAETRASEVLPLALKHRPDLIVLDVHQQIDGRELLVQLRADPRTSDVRMVMVSGSDWPMLEEECLKLGADAFLAKPYPFEALQAPQSFRLEWTQVFEGPQAPQPPARLTMLIADDSPQMVAALVRAAHREGIATLTDTTSTQVMELARAHQPGLIVLDLHQAIDGRDLLTSLKADPLTRNIKVVMLSGEESQLTRQDCFKLGAEDYFVKPLDPLFFRRISKIAGVQAAH